MIWKLTVSEAGWPVMTLAIPPLVQCGEVGAIDIHSEIVVLVTD